MYDFLTIKLKPVGKNSVMVMPSFKVSGSIQDLMIRGRDFYAVWDPETKMWSKDESVVSREVDKSIQDKIDELEKVAGYDKVSGAFMSDGDSGSMDKFHKYCQKLMRDHFHQLDTKIIFANTPTTKKDYASKRLPYKLEDGDISSYDKLMNTLYDPNERRKIEWVIGAIASGDSKNIQKFLVLYGEPGSGKSTVINIIQQMFGGYCTVFRSKDLGKGSDSFALEAFKNDPLVAVEHDADLSGIEDNTRLNSIASHEVMEINEKFKGKYTAKFNAIMIIGTNEMVRISDARSGLVRRLIDVSPSGRKIPYKDYQPTIDDIYQNELGHIAKHCVDLYNKYGRGYYNNYVPIAMIRGTNDFYNFVDDNFLQFKENDPVSLSTTWGWYKEYVDSAGLKYSLTKTKFRAELRSYYKSFSEVGYIGGKHVRNLYSGFIADKFSNTGDDNKLIAKPNEATWIKMKDQKSLFDEQFKDCLAQYARDDGAPTRKWVNCKTKLKDIDTKKLHYIQVPENLIVIDFDIKGEDGSKNAELNLAAATKFPRTYAEFSKSGSGIHLHYFYDGDASKLSRLYDDNIEVKVFTGNSSLRRMLTKCNDIPIATMQPGYLPLKGDNKRMIDWDGVKNEKMLRTMIIKNLRKEYHPATKPSVDYIYKLLDDAYTKGLSYDVSDLEPEVMAFCAGSTHQSDYCLKLFQKMKFKSEDQIEDIKFKDDGGVVFFDVEVMPNKFGIVYKPIGKKAVQIPEPTIEDVQNLCKMKLVGFNCRRYDNHILYAKMLGYTNEMLFDLSQRIVNGDKTAFFGEAYNISYTDIYDFSSKKQSLKKFEIELGIHHQENHYPWDKPVTDEQWKEIMDYCENDVMATEAVWNDRAGDFEAREIITELANIFAKNTKSTVNDTTNTLSGRMIFGDEKNPQKEFIYTDLATGIQYGPGETPPKRKEYADPIAASIEIAKEHPIEDEWKKGNFNYFPGYIFQGGKSYYLGEEVGEGGYVYSEPGVYTHAETQDVASMHPSDAIRMNIFGDRYTKQFASLLQLRLYIKHKEFDKAKAMFGGALAPYLTDEKRAKALSKALKIVINSVYGLTSAKFLTKFKDVRNVDNIVAKRGALIMLTLKHKLQKEGYEVFHIKTDSIKVANMTDAIRKEIRDYGKQFGLIFETEHVFDRICLVNDAVYVARLADNDPDDPGKWTATGTQFQVPYVFKTLFSHEPIEFKDMCETKSVQTALYLDFNENLPEGEHKYEFVGKVGQFTPIKPGKGGGLLLREKDGKYSAATGTKGYRWMESTKVAELHKEKDVDKRYYKNLVDEAVASISEYCDIEWFTADKKNDSLEIVSDELPF